MADEIVRSSHLELFLPLTVFLQGSPVFYDNWVAQDINGTALEKCTLRRNIPSSTISLPLSMAPPSSGSIMLEWHSCPGPRALLQPAACTLQDGQDIGGECSASKCNLR